MINFLYNLYPIEEIIPSIIRLYIGLGETIQIGVRIINETSILRHYSNITYIDNYKQLYPTSVVTQVYLDIPYWDHLIKQLPHCGFNYNNHFNAKISASAIVFQFEKPQLWFELYPISNYDLFWMSKINGTFKVQFQGFVFPNLLDLSFISKESLKHHDYVSTSMISTNIFFHGNMTGVNQSHYGCFFFWYEHYGAVEIGLKTIFTYWYQLWYPQFEEMGCLIDIPTRTYPVSISDKQYFFRLPEIFEESFLTYKRKANWGVV